MPSNRDSGSDSHAGWANFACSMEQKQKKKILPLTSSDDDEWDTFVTSIIPSHQTGNSKVPI